MIFSRLNQVIIISIAQMKRMPSGDVITEFNGIERDGILLAQGITRSQSWVYCLERELVRFFRKVDRFILLEL